MKKNLFAIVALMLLMIAGCTKKPEAPVAAPAQTPEATSAPASAESAEKCPAGKYTSGQYSPEMTIPLAEGRSILVCGSRDGVENGKVRMSEFDLFVKGLEPQPKLFFSASALDHFNVIAKPNEGVELESLLFLAMDDSGSNSWVPFYRFAFECTGAGCMKGPEECVLGTISPKLHENAMAQYQAKVSGQANAAGIEHEVLLRHLLIRSLMGDNAAATAVGNFDTIFHTDGGLSEEVTESKNALNRSVTMPCRFKR